MSEFHHHDLTSRQIEAVGGAVFHRLKKLRAAADASMVGSPAQEAYDRFYMDWQNGSDDDRRQLVAEAEREEACQGVTS